MASFGSAFTGQGDQTDEPLKNIVTGAGAALNRSVFDDPASRSALLQIGLNLMQPQAQGQSVAGHIGEAVGAGGEAVGRQEEGDIKQQLADTKLQRAQDLMDIAKLKMAQGPEGMTAYQRIQADLAAKRETRGASAEERAQSREERMAKAAEEADIRKEVDAGEAMRDNLVKDDTDPAKAPYVGKTRAQIRAMVIAGRGGGAETAPPQTAGSDLPPPRADRVPGQTKWRGHVWAKDPATGRFGWAGQ